ncbi:MAG: NAD(P)/FAD-dependent oxidoreductase [Halanaerobiaceae bacterium]
MEYLIIGNSAAGIGGVEGIRKCDPGGEIRIISREPYHTYSRPLISYYLAGGVDIEKMKYRPDDFYENNRVDVILNKEVVGLNTDDKKVILENDETYNYDRLLIAAGGSPFIPPIEGTSKNNVYTFLELDDAKEIKKAIDSLTFKGYDSGKVIILGAGLIGLKAAEALTKLGLEVSVVELADRILSTILDKEAAAIIQSHLEERGINFYLSDTIKEFIGGREAVGAILKSGTTINCDLAVIAVGVRPNTSLVKDMEIAVNRGILVNDKLETSIEDVYAAGDVCEGYDMLRREKSVIPIWPGAYKEGYTAGQNMAGSKKVYKEGFARNSIGFFGLPMITAGLINPDGNNGTYDVFTEKSIEDKSYRKIIISRNKLMGFIYLNNIDRAGILTGLIKEQKDIRNIKEKILSADFGYHTVRTFD